MGDLAYIPLWPYVSRQKLCRWIAFFSKHTRSMRARSRHLCLGLFFSLALWFAYLPHYHIKVPLFIIYHVTKLPQNLYVNCGIMVD